MSETTPNPQPCPSGPARPRRRFLRRAVIATVIGTVVAGVTAGVGLTAFAQARGHGGWHRAGFMGGPMTEAHLDRMLKHLYVEIDATDAQKQQIAPIVKAAVRELAPVHARMHEARRQAVELLTRESVDRGALETLRAEQLALAEQASRRLVQALADLADALTPEQRKEVAERLGRWPGRHHG